MASWMQLFLTALIVAGGIFVYDAFLQRAPEPAPEVITRDADTAAAPQPEETKPFAVLEGTGDDLWRDGVDRRLEVLEGRGASSSKAAGDTEVGGDGTSMTTETEEGEDPGAEDAATDDPNAPRAIQREEFKRFRKMLEAVERQRKWEQAARKISQFLDKIGSSLTQEQRRDVVKTTLAFQERWRRLGKMPTVDEQAKAERRAAGQALFAEYERAIQDCAPAAEADLIIQAIQGKGDGR